MATKKFSIDNKTARQLEDMRSVNGWSWKQMYAYYFGLGLEEAPSVSDLDADALRKQVERKKHLAHEQVETVQQVLEPQNQPKDMAVEYTLKDSAIDSAVGTVTLAQEDASIGDAVALINALFTEFNLNEDEFELVKYKPIYTSKSSVFKVWAQFKRKEYDKYSSDEVIRRYTENLMSLGSVKIPTVFPIDTGNLLVINLADIHWNKMPYIGFSGEYLAQFEQDIYNKLAQILKQAQLHEISRAVLTVGHDFFQTNDSKGGTKKGTPVSHIMEYKDMFDTGTRILANCLRMVAVRYVTDCYYVLANHDNDASWHATRELKLMYRDVGHVNLFVDKAPFHHVEWGSTLIELTHDNIRGGRGKSTMAVTAREAWGRTKYHYSIGGHLHGEYTTKETNGVVTMGSRALSDTDEWHYLNGYIGNIRGIQSYVFNKDGGHVASFNANL